MTQLWTRHVELNNLRSTQQAVSCFLSVCLVELKMRVAVASTVSLDTSVCAKCTSSEKRKTRCPLRSWAVSQAPWERQAGAYQLQCHKSNCNSRCESGFSDKAEAVHCASAASRLVLLGHSVHTHTHPMQALKCHRQLETVNRCALVSDEGFLHLPPAIFCREYANLTFSCGGHPLFSLRHLQDNYLTLGTSARDTRVG